MMPAARWVWTPLCLAAALRFCTAGRLPTSIPATVTSIDVSYGLYTGSVPTQWGLLTLLTSLNIAENELTNQLPTELGALTGMADGFSIYRNEFNGTVPSQLGAFTALSTGFYTYTNQLSVGVPTQFGKLTSLTDNFRMHKSTKMGGTVPTQLGQWSLFKGYFYMYGTQISGTLPTELGRWTGLTHTASWHTAANTGTIPTQYGNWVGLTSQFRICNSYLTGPLPSEIGRLSALATKLYLFGNNHTTIPTQIGRLTSLVDTVYAYDAQFSGTLPTEIGLLESLSSVFQLYDNELTGPLPSELGALTQYSRDIQLQYNQWCDDLPTEVSALSSGVFDFYASEGASFGTRCCNVFPGTYDCSPTQAPTVVPTPFCHPGEFLDRDVCEPCEAGKYRNATDAPAVCAACPAGTYRGYSTNRLDALACDDCPSGKLSTVDRTDCEECSAGQYTFNDTSCVDCEAGRYAPVALDDDCFSCVAGSATGSATGATSCESCDAGTYSAAESVNCSTCGVGTYSTTRSEKCTDCEAGKFSESTGASSCLKCASEFGAGYTSRAGADGCSRCRKEYVRHNGNCVACPSGSQCSAPGTVTATLPIRAGYWRYDDTTLTVSECPHGTKSCQGGNITQDNSLCITGSFGPYCAVCESGWFRPNEASACKKCPSNIDDGWNTSSTFSKVVLVVLLIIGTHTLFVFVRTQGPKRCRQPDAQLELRSQESSAEPSAQPRSSRGLLDSTRQILGKMYEVELEVERVEYRMTEAGKDVVKSKEFIHSAKHLGHQIKIIIKTFQIIGSWALNFTVFSWPKSWTNWVSMVSSVFAFDVLKIFPGLNSCSVSTRTNVYVVHLIFITVAPLVIFTMLGATYFVMQFRFDKTPWRHQTLNWIMTIGLFFAFCIFAAVSTTIFLFFLQDTELESKTGECYLTVDYATRCDTNTYTIMAVYAALMVLVYPIGIPLSYYILLLRNLADIDPFLPDGTRPRIGEPGFDELLELRENNKELERLAFLFDSYEPEYWWFEVFECARRLLLGSVSALLWPGTERQIMITLLIALPVLKVLTFTQPFVDDEDDILAEVSQWALVCTLIWMLCITNGSIFPSSFDAPGLLFISGIVFVVGLKHSMGQLAILLLPVHLRLKVLSPRYYGAFASCMSGVCRRFTVARPSGHEGKESEQGVELCAVEVDTEQLRVRSSLRSIHGEPEGEEAYEAEVMAMLRESKGGDSEEECPPVLGEGTGGGVDEESPPVLGEGKGGRLREEALPIVAHEESIEVVTELVVSEDSAELHL